MITTKKKMTDVIKRKELEELMFSLSFKITTDNDIKRINDIYAMNQSDFYIFRLTNTKIYFEQIIVPYCQQNFTSIIKTINDQNIQNQFRNNFEQRNSKQEPTRTTHNDFDDGHLEEELIPKNHKKSCFFIFRKICVYMTLILFAIFICFMLCFMVKGIIHFF